MRQLVDFYKAILLTVIRPFVVIWMWFLTRVHIKKHDGFSFWRQTPYVMLASHTFKWDVVQVPLRLAKVPYIVGSQTLFRKQPLKFIMKHVARVVSKSKGQSDIQTVKRLFRAVKDGYPILIFPEGNVSFFQTTGYIEPSTYKLVKKLAIDVVVAHVSGGYLSRPRWAKHPRSNRHIYIDYSIPIRGEEIKSMSLKEIEQKIRERLIQNDFEWNQTHKHPYPSKQLAKGLEDLLYVCPNCNSLHSLETSGNLITCNHCSSEGRLDEYGKIHGFKIDNIPEWDEFQRTFLDELKLSEFESKAMMEYTNYETLKVIKVGAVNIKYHNHRIVISGAHNETIDVDKIKNPILLLRTEWTFVYNNRNYTFYLEKHIQSFLRVTQKSTRY
jgi:1-acyl-sn-glycerol-3-phosphate acyltransferase